MLSSLLLVVFLCNLGLIEAPHGSQPATQLSATVTPEEQRAWIKIEVIRGTPPADIARNLRAAIPAHAFSERHILRICQEFLSGTRTESSEKPREGRPKTATNLEMQEKLKHLMVELDGPRSEELAMELGISDFSVRSMLHDLGYRYTLTRWVPHELSEEQKSQRVKTARYNLNLASAEPTLLGRIIAIDETWLPSYLPLTDIQARTWKKEGEEG